MGTMLLAIYFTFSRGGLLGLATVLALFGWKHKSLAVRVALIGVLAGGIVVVGVSFIESSVF